MIDPEMRVKIRRYFYAEHWKVGTIAQALGVHPDTVKRAIEVERFHRTEQLRSSKLDPYVGFVRQTLEAHPGLCATRLEQMLCDRGYRGSVRNLRRVVARLRPQRHEAFLRLQVFAGEQAQVDWASFGTVMVGRAKRALSCFVMTLSWSRALYLEFFFDQTMESFLRGHVNAFRSFSGSARILLYDNLKSAVLERRSNQIHFNPRLLELAGHYHFEPRPCQVRSGNQKGRVERAIRFVRDSYWAARTFTTLEECNRQALKWRDEVAYQRPWPDNRNRIVAEVFAEERPRLLELPLHEFDTDRVVMVRAAKTIYVRFDGNDYSIPPETVGRTLTLAASDTEVRILDGAQEIAHHRRSYNRQQLVLDPAHQQALLRTKRKARESTRNGRLELSVPESADLLDRAFAEGESAAQQSAQLLDLLDRYGTHAMRRAVREALRRSTPRASSVAFLLRQSNLAAPLPLDLSRHPEAQNLEVRPHDLETYDELAHRRDDEPER
ncbi:IS21 family transposase [Telmatobacter bradus]|uniref:IS21 family transposase n=1 Tax=Telmatobacter bradus TaxID=474953 RepID=UPI003B42EF3A